LYSITFCILQPERCAGFETFLRKRRSFIAGCEPECFQARSLAVRSARAVRKRNRLDVRLDRCPLPRPVIATIVATQVRTSKCLIDVITTPASRRPE
jgi:hypothetical protein